MQHDTYPHSIDNGAGERLTFIRRISAAAGERLEMETTVAPGAGPPMHIHHLQEEVLTVQQGRMGFQRRGESTQFAGPGETVSFKPGEAHRFWNAGDDELRCVGYIEPAANVEYILVALFASMQRRGVAQPDPFDAAFLARRYRSEFGIAGIPVVVQRCAFPILVGIGSLSGRYGKYADAPAPVRR